MIKDKVVIITGASSGIGEATARLLASNGAKVVLSARREDKLKQIVEAIKRDGGQAVYQGLDVTDPAANVAVVDRAKKEFGGVDVIFLNAGIMPNSPLSAMKTDDWRQTVTAESGSLWRASPHQRFSAECSSIGPPAHTEKYVRHLSWLRLIPWLRYLNSGPAPQELHHRQAPADRQSAIPRGGTGPTTWPQLRDGRLSARGSASVANRRFSSGRFDLPPGAVPTHGAPHSKR